MPDTPRASCAGRRKAPTKVTGSPARWAAWSVVRSAPASAVPWARSRACSGYPTADTGAAIAAAGTTIVTAISGVIDCSVIPGLEANLRRAIAHRGISRFRVWSFAPSRNDAFHPGMRLWTGRAARGVASILQPVPGLEDPPHQNHADHEEAERDA